MFRDARYIRSEEELKVPVHLNFGKFVLDRIRVKKDEIAVINVKTEEKMTYCELTQYAVNTACALLKLGVGVGDVVALCSENRNEFMAISIGIILTGATCSLIPATAGRASLLHKLQLCKPKHIITTKHCWDMYKASLSKECVSILTIEDIDEEIVTTLNSLFSNDFNVDHFEPAKVNGQTDVAVIWYTSGSTGESRGIKTSHLVHIANSSIFKSFENPEHKVLISAGDFAYVTDYYRNIAFLLLGKTTVYFDWTIPSLFLKGVNDYKADTAILFPSLIHKMTDYEATGKYNLQSLTYVCTATSTLDHNLREKYLRMYPNVKTFIQIYGMTESFALTSEQYGIPGLKKNTVGKVAPRITLKVVDPNTKKILGPNQHGELYFEAHNVFNGYVGKDPSTYLDKEGFFPTGDLVYYDEDGYFYIVDRIKEIIKFNGYTISPVQIEKLLLRHPGVQDAGVVGKPTPDLEELPTAFVVKKEGVNVTEKELIDYISYEGAAEMKLRGGVKFVNEIPRTFNGKIQRQHLRDMLNA